MWFDLAKPYLLPPKMYGFIGWNVPFCKVKGYVWADCPKSSEFSVRRTERLRDDKKVDVGQEWAWKRRESKDGSSSLGSKFIGKGAQYSWKSVTFAGYKQNKEIL